MYVFLLSYISFIMKKDFFSFLILLFCIILLFMKQTSIQATIISSCQLFFYQVFPSLFPFMILSDLLIYFRIPHLLSHFLSPLLSRLFHVSSVSCYVFFISLFSGSPTNAYIIKNLVLNNNLTPQEASHIMSFSFFSNPLFLYSLFSYLFPTSYSLAILLTLYLTNVLIGLFTRPSSYQNHVFSAPKMPDFGQYLTQSLRNAMNTLIFVLGSIVLFSLINVFINPYEMPFIKCILEISQGLHSLRDVSSILGRSLLTLITCSFGGLSIHMQVKGILSEANISYTPFLKARFIQGILSVTLFLLIHYAFL